MAAISIMSLSINSVIDIYYIPLETGLMWMPKHLVHHLSTWVQVMPWCHQVPRHYLTSFWPRTAMMPSSGTNQLLSYNISHSLPSYWGYVVSMWGTFTALYLQILNLRNHWSEGHLRSGHNLWFSSGYVSNPSDHMASWHQVSIKVAHKTWAHG